MKVLLSRYFVLLSFSVLPYSQSLLSSVVALAHARFASISLESVQGPKELYTAYHGRRVRCFISEAVGEGDVDSLFHWDSHYSVATVSGSSNTAIGLPADRIPSLGMQESNAWVSAI